MRVPRIMTCLLYRKYLMYHYRALRYCQLSAPGRIRTLILGAEIRYSIR